MTSSTAESLDSTPPGASISTPGGSNPESGMLDTLVVASIDPMGYLFGPESLRRIHSIDIG